MDAYYAGRQRVASADARRQGTVFFTPFNDTVQRQLAHGLFDASAQFSRATRAMVGGRMGQNLTIATYITGSFSSPPPAIGGRPGEPRRAGVSR